MMKNWKPAKKPAMKILGAWQAGQGNMPWQGRFYLPWQVFGRQVADPSWYRSCFLFKSHILSPCLKFGPKKTCLDFELCIQKPVPEDRTGYLHT